MTTIGPDGIEYPTIVIEGFNALYSRDYDRFEELLNNGLDINSYGPYENTFILSQIVDLDIRTVEFLLQNGINSNIPARHGLTPLDYIYVRRNMSIYSDDEERRSTIIEDMLRDYGGYTQREILRTLVRLPNGRLVRRAGEIVSDESNSQDSIPSDPDYELMRNQAATQIQKRMRGRQTRQNRNYTRRNTGIESMNPTRRERFRRFTDHNRILDENDPLSGYLHDVYFPSSKISSKRKVAKRKVAKRTKKKRNRKNRY